MTNNSFKEQIGEVLDTCFISKKRLEEFIKELEVKIKKEEQHKQCSRQYFLGFLDALCEIDTKFCGRIE